MEKEGGGRSEMKESTAHFTATRLELLLLCFLVSFKRPGRKGKREKENNCPGQSRALPTGAADAIHKTIGTVGRRSFGRISVLRGGRHGKCGGRI